MFNGLIIECKGTTKNRNTQIFVGFYTKYPQLYNERGGIYRGFVIYSALGALGAFAFGAFGAAGASGAGAAGASCAGAAAGAARNSPVVSWR